MRALADLFDRRGIRTHFQIEAGQGHTWSEARAGLPYGLRVFGLALASPVTSPTVPLKPGR